MIKRKVLVYYAWSRPGESGAPLHVIDDRFPGFCRSKDRRAHDNDIDSTAYVANE
jgi:hypothetical protein